VTRNNQTDRFTIEKLSHDCLDIRELRRRGFLNDGRVEIDPSIRWPKIARMTIERYRIKLSFWRQVTTQCVRVSWTKVHLGGERPWMHCPHCETRVARLYAGLGGYLPQLHRQSALREPAARRPREGPLSGVQTSSSAQRRGAAFTSVSGAPAQYALAYLRPAQTRGDEP
jgi:hypothetical protein